MTNHQFYYLKKFAQAERAVKRAVETTMSHRSLSEFGAALGKQDHILYGRGSFAKRADEMPNVLDYTKLWSDIGVNDMERAGDLILDSIKDRDNAQLTKEFYNDFFTELKHRKKNVVKDYAPWVGGGAAVGGLAGAGIGQLAGKHPILGALLGVGAGAGAGGLGKYLYNRYTSGNRLSRMKKVIGH